MKRYMRAFRGWGRVRGALAGGGGGKYKVVLIPHRTHKKKAPACHVCFEKGAIQNVVS